MEESDRSVMSTPQNNTGNSSSQETADNSIPALAENINHTINWINSTYRPKKKSADFPRAELYTLLCTKVDDLACNILPQLQEEKTSSALNQFVSSDNSPFTSSRAGCARHNCTQALCLQPCQGHQGAGQSLC